MIVLALDTALKACSLAIIKDGAVLFDEFNPLEKGHAEVLPQLAARALKTTGIRPDAIDRIGVTIGPGGFTGVRVGLAFARGFVIGQKAQAVGIDTLTALFHSYAAPVHPAIDPGAVNANGLTAVVVDARRGEVFAALFSADGGARLAPFAAAPEAALAQLTEEAGAAPINLIDPDNILPAPTHWSRIVAKPGADPIALALLIAAANPADHPPDPLYLRAPDAKPSTKSAAVLFEGLAN